MRLTLVKIMPASPDVSTFVWQPDQPFNWTAGQYLEYHLPHDADDRGEIRWFTISSAPEDKTLELSTKFAETRSSSFKTALRQMAAGQTIEAKGPMGDFTLDSKRPAVMIAGGIGITPYRAMIRSAAARQQHVTGTLLYGNRDETFPFRDELDQLVSSLGDFTIDYVTEPKRISIGDIEAAAAAYTNPIYYVSGPAPMVSYYEEILKSIGISDDSIRLDDFPNYEWTPVSD